MGGTTPIVGGSTPMVEGKSETWTGQLQPSLIHWSPPPQPYDDYLQEVNGGEGAMEHPKTVVGTFPKEMETRMALRLNGIPAYLTLNKTWNTVILFLLDEEK